MSHRLFRPVNIIRAGLWLAAGVLLAGCDSSGPAAPAAPPQVTVAVLAPQSVMLSRQLPGRVNPVAVAEVRPQVDGIIQRRLFTEGSIVTAGQPLYQLDDAIYRAEVTSARASLARAEAGLHTATLDARRADELVRSGAVSRDQHEKAMAALREAEADVQVAEAALKTSEIRLGYSRISAPIGGYIGHSQMTAGALVTANQDDPLARIQQLDPVYVDLHLAAQEWLQLRAQRVVVEPARAGAERSGVEDSGVGSTDIEGTGTEDTGIERASVAVLLEDGSRHPQQGTLAFADRSVDPSSGAVLLRAVVPNPDNRLLPGMYVRAVIDTVRLDHALLAPQQAISRDPKGQTTALIVNAANQVELRAVQVSRTVGDQWLVAGGLAPGDRVIVAGLQKVRPGMAVDPVEASAETRTGTPAPDAQQDADGETRGAAASLNTSASLPAPPDRAGQG